MGCNRQLPTWEATALERAMSSRFPAYTTIRLLAVRKSHQRLVSSVPPGELAFTSAAFFTSTSLASVSPGAFLQYGPVEVVQAVSHGAENEGEDAPSSKRGVKGGRSDRI